MAGFGHIGGLEKDLALSLGRSFGGALGLGFPCGAVIGALMALGLGRPLSPQGDKQSRYSVYEEAREFARRFQEQHGTIWCSDLLGLDMRDPKAQKQAARQGLYSKLCPKFVKTASQIVESILAERP